MYGGDKIYGLFRGFFTGLIRIIFSESHSHIPVDKRMKTHILRGFPALPESRAKRRRRVIPVILLR